MGEKPGHPFRGNQWTTGRKTGAFPLTRDNVVFEKYSVFVHGADDDLRVEEDFDKADAAWRALTKDAGREMGMLEVAAVAGILPGETISRMSIEDGHIRVQSYKERTVNLNGNEVYERVYYKDRSVMLLTGVIYNESFSSKERNAGHGTRMMVQQVEAASAHGFKKISVYAAGSGPVPPSGRRPGMVVEPSSQDSNGYYTWARTGFLPARDAGQGASATISVVGPSGRISQINWLRMMSTKSGRDWWKAHGHSFTGEFDLTEGSISRRALAGYAREKGIA
jgi:hypothetical protein